MTGATQTLTPEATARMTACGANLTGFDQLQPFDGRLAASVWSWAPDQPGTGSCAYSAGDGRFHAGGCGRAAHFACVDPHLDWHVTDAVGRWRDGFAACPEEFPGSSYAVPPNGYRNSELVAAKASPDEQVWLDYAKVAGAWTPDVRARLLQTGHSHRRRTRGE
jgi:hypothetical protein